MADRVRKRDFVRALGALASVLLIGSCSSTTLQWPAIATGFLSHTTNSAIAPMLARFIRHSRNSALEEGTRPIPAHVKEALEPYFEMQLLHRVRWTTASDRWTIDTFIRATHPSYVAITLEDVIVFLDPSATGEMKVWIHELLHIQQVQGEGGINRFSRKYVAGWRHMEDQTIEQTIQILSDIKKDTSVASARD